MAVRIRLMRMGRRNLPYYRIAVFDGRTRRDGPYLEKLGTYDPKESKPEEKIKLNLERYRHWVSQGARPTEALARIFRHTQTLEKK